MLVLPLKVWSSATVTYEYSSSCKLPIKPLSVHPPAERVKHIPKHGVTIGAQPSRQRAVEHDADFTNDLAQDTFTMGSTAAVAPWRPHHRFASWRSGCATCRAHFVRPAQAGFSLNAISLDASEIERPLAIATNATQSAFRERDHSLQTARTFMTATAFDH